MGLASELSIRFGVSAVICWEITRLFCAKIMACLLLFVNSEDDVLEIRHKVLRVGDRIFHKC
jgi:hypothetical protein